VKEKGSNKIQRINLIQTILSTSLLEVLVLLCSIIMHITMQNTETVPLLYTYIKTIITSQMWPKRILGEILP